MLENELSSPYREFWRISNAWLDEVAFETFFEYGFIHTFIDQCRACWSFFRTFCKVSFWFEVTDAYSMLSLSTISHASYNPSNDFIRIINYQIFLNQLKWNHPILATTILSMNGSVHTQTPLTNGTNPHSQSTQRKIEWRGKRKRILLVFLYLFFTLCLQLMEENMNIYYTMQP